MRNFLKLFVSLGFTLGAGALGSVFTVDAIPTWYATLAKPALTPPSWVFGPVWTTLYVLIGVSAFLVWKRGWERRDVRVALGAFAVQLVLNTAWSIIFFTLQSPFWALVDIALLWLAILWTFALFHRVSKTAAYLLVPYLLWVSFASYLNFAIWRLAM